MFQVGPLEIVVVLVIALLVLGPQRLPDVARSVGRGMREFRNALDHDGDDEPEEQPKVEAPAKAPAKVPDAKSSPQA